MCVWCMCVFVQVFTWVCFYICWWRYSEWVCMYILDVSMALFVILYCTWLPSSYLTMHDCGPPESQDWWWGEGSTRTDIQLFIMAIKYCCSICWQCYPLYISLFQPLWCSSNIIGLEAALLVNCLHYVSSNVARVAYCNRLGIEAALLASCILPCITISLALCEL